MLRPSRHRSVLFAALVISRLSLPLTAATWHVSGRGDDTHDGTTESSAFRTLPKAAAVVAPGDTVLIGDGSYVDGSATMESSVVVLARSGRPDAWITWKNAPGAHPEIHASGWNGILVTASYQIIDGLTVIGSNDSIFLQEAINDARNPKPAGRFNTNGIYVNGRLKEADAKPHHVVIRHCSVGKCGGGGIIAIQTDYVTIEDNRVFENAWFSRYGCSGISTLTNWSFDRAEGYHMIIQRNLVWNNRGLVPWEKIAKLSDGNGIILDVSDLDGAATNPTGDAAVPVNPTGDAAKSNPIVPSPTPTVLPKAPRPEWFGRSLVANNVSVGNGGSGIHTFRTKHVDIINNTTYWNGQTVGYQEIFANHSEDIVILNNVMVPRPGGKVTSNNRNTSVRWDYNLYPGEPAVIAGPHDINADPRLVNVDPNPTKGDFHLAPQSPGRKSGTTELAQPTDLTGKARASGSAPDRGAYQQ